MMHWLHAVMPEQAPLVAGTGGGGGFLSHLEARGLRLVYEVCGSMPEPTRDNVLAYGRAVQRLCGTHEALPFRYGTAVAKEHDAVEILEKRSGEWLRRLSAVQGLSEFIVHAVQPTASPTRTTRTGADYLAARAEEMRRIRTWGESLSGMLSSLCREFRTLSRSAGLVRLACLSSAAAADLESLLVRWQRDHEVEATWVTGPWPPFSFVTEAESS
jgi:hypothetical protein